MYTDSFVLTCNSLGPTPGVGEIPYYLRFSNTDFLQGLLDTKPIDVLESLVSSSVDSLLKNKRIYAYIFYDYFRFLDH